MKRSLFTLSFLLFTVFADGCYAQVTQNQLDQVARMQSLITRICSEASVLAHDIVVMKERNQTPLQIQQFIDNSGIPLTQKARLTGLINLLFARPASDVQPMELATRYYMNCVTDK